MPAIAVVMPVYNREDTVGRAIESVLAQDFSDFQLVLVDDGSTDGSVAAIERYDDPRIALLRQDRNQGGNAARNRGVLVADAPLIAFLDSDDVFLPHKLGFLVDYFDRREDVDVLIDSFDLVYPPATGRPTVRRVNPVIEDSRAIEQAIFGRRLFKATPAISVRKTAAIEAGLFDETLKRRQDFDFVLRLTRVARCASTDAVLWTKQWSENAISAKKNTFMDATVDLVRRHPAYLADDAFRPGLARDVARHFVRQLSGARVGDATRDARKFAAAFGAGTLARLVVSGLGEMRRRKADKG